MTYAPNQRFASQAGDPIGQAVFPESTQTKLFPANGLNNGEFPALFPVSYSDTVGGDGDPGFEPWPGDTAAVWTLGISADGGTFTLTFNGVETGNIEWDASVSTLIDNIQAAVEATFGEGVVRLGDEDPYVTFTLDKQFGAGGVTVSVDGTNLTLDGDTPAALIEETTEFEAGPEVTGFLERKSTISSSADVLLPVHMSGRILAQAAEESFESMGGNRYQLRRALQSRATVGGSGGWIVENLTPPTY